MSVREQILQATLELCAKRGIAATSLQDIADASECSKANVVYHFAHKEELLNEALTPSLKATETLVSSAEAQGLGSAEEKVVFARNLVTLLVTHRLATHIVITHPFLVDAIPALHKAQVLMTRLADLVSRYSTDELDRLRFGVVISGVTYTLVSATILEIQSLPETELTEMLTHVVSTMVMGSALAAEAGR